ncbi:hypothetical protein EHQ96_09260 [Leptospira levettii]|uniref:Uncharacterized protein n=4 Tax=Leptospira TaxID=171 RepID=A0A2N0AU35_9LEPT|nr:MULTISPECIES: hypothetical protein [Leptospira]PKA28416.1 hypothetical protein CH381_01050 [Leptospira sp. mixed culture ATI2-C-A1]MBL0953663.1 hypothetical protein [Leptospira sp.]MCG6147772.1 hypothetical protein [Leptospira levettii]MCW7464946.1 hypothetical protein [Leptospira levettii]MCW7473786.1 hypothetical protein [Leptospira levettii]
MEDDFLDDDEFDAESLNEDVVTYACEDCDHRWEAEGEDEYLDSWELICPMCGSANITEL